jgi:hypothetical protein
MGNPARKRAATRINFSNPIRPRLTGTIFTIAGDLSTNFFLSENTLMKSHGQETLDGTRTRADIFHSVNPTGFPSAAQRGTTQPDCHY